MSKIGEEKKSKICKFNHFFCPFLPSFPFLTIFLVWEQWHQWQYICRFYFTGSFTTDIISWFRPAGDANLEFDIRLTVSVTVTQILDLKETESE